jgi:hypothetical protein
MKRDVEVLERQKRETDMIVKRYIEKYGSLEPETQTTE